MNVAQAIPNGSEFQNFLYAPICQEHDGMTLSVLSAIARQDIDPWTEAARLAQLPEQTAVAQIRNLIDSLPRRTLACLDSVEVAARLSRLLPRLATRAAPDSPRTQASQNPTGFAFNWRFFCLYLCLMVLMNWFLAENRAPSAAVNSADTASAGVPARPADATNRTAKSGETRTPPPTSDH